MEQFSSAPHRRKRILLVEDDAAVRRSLQLVLAGDGFDVRAYGDARDLAKDAEAMEASCLVADLILQGTDAIDLLSEMRAAGWTGSTILISGNLNKRWRSEADRVGFDAVLEKPVSGGPLLKEIHRLLGTE